MHEMSPLLRVDDCLFINGVKNVQGDKPSRLSETPRGQGPYLPCSLFYTPKQGLCSACPGTQYTRVN